MPPSSNESLAAHAGCSNPIPLAFDMQMYVPAMLPGQGVKKLVDLIFSKSKPKRFGNGLMSGPVLAGLVEAYVDAINKGAVPTIATAWQVCVFYVCVSWEREF